MLMEKSPETRVPETKIKNAGTVGWFQNCVHRSRSEIFSEVKTITPAMAEVILTNNPDNRQVRQAKFMQLVADMREGRWSFNGEPIIIAKTGELNDGQHRLLALIEAKVSLPMLFVFGVERETRTTVDQGANRGPSDYLSMSGVANAASAAAIARMCLSFEKNGCKQLGVTSRITAAQVVERVQNDRTIATSATYCGRHKYRTQRFASTTVIGFCHNVLLREDVNDGLAFMEMLCTGENLSREDPAFRARERLMALDTKGAAARIEVIFRAWNAYREKRTLRTIPIHGRLPELV